MNYASIIYYDMVNSDSISHSIFVSGCEFYCKNCQNKSLWNFNHGETFTKSIQQEFISRCKKDEQENKIQSISILGGEPLHPRNIPEVLSLIKQLKSQTNLKILVWTGFTYENLLLRADKETQELLTLIDVLIDGLYIEELRNLNLLLRGSSNQRVLDIKSSLEKGEPILYLE